MPCSFSLQSESNMHCSGGIQLSLLSLPAKMLPWQWTLLKSSVLTSGFSRTWLYKTLNSDCGLPNGCKQSFLGQQHTNFWLNFSSYPSSKHDMPFSFGHFKYFTKLTLFCSSYLTWKSGSFRVTDAQQLAESVQAPWRNWGKPLQLTSDGIHRRVNSFPFTLYLPCSFFF